jgi:hypothetical protein
MAMHKFKVGQTVFLQPTIANRLEDCAYKVRAQLPIHDGQFQYRIKSSTEPYEGVAKENELSLE